MPYQHAETLDRRVIASFREGAVEGAPDIASLLIEQFLQEAAGQADRLRDAGQCGDAAALKSAAHNLKGSATTMGARRLGVICTALEAHAAARSSAIGASALIADLLAELDRELVNVSAALLAECEGVSRT